MINTFHKRRAILSSTLPDLVIGFTGALPSWGTEVGILGITSLEVGDIQNFQVVGQEITMNVSAVNYSVLDSAFSNDLSITYFNDNADKVNQIDNTVFYGTTNLVSVKLDALSFIDGNGSFYLSGILTLSLPSLITKTGDFIHLVRQAPNITYLDLSNMTTYTGKNGLMVYRATSLIELRLDSMTQMGNTVLYTQFLREIAFGCTIYVNTFLATNNAGGEDGDIAYARSTRSCTIIYV